MLVLTRRVGESIRIGDHVRLTIRGKVRNHYTVAIAAPSDLSIVDGDGEQLTALRHRQRRKRCYVVALLAGESLRIGDEVHVTVRRRPLRRHAAHAIWTTGAHQH